MIKHYIKEAKECLKNALYLSALSLCLILIDACAEVESPKSTNKKRYTDWIKKYLLHYFNENGFKNDNTFNINHLYFLRCNVLHEGRVEINKENIYFEFYVNTSDRGNVLISEVNEEINKIGDEEIRKIEYTINLKWFCDKIIKSVEHYYTSNPLKFKNKNINIFYTSKRIAKIFRFNQQDFNVYQ